MSQKVLSVPDTDGKYLKINVIARRAKALARSGKATIPYAEGNFDPIEVALEEYTKKKLQICRRDETTQILEPFPTDL